MSQPLGLTPANEAKYVAHLWSSHDFAIQLDILALDHTPIASLTNITGMVLDGQVNIAKGEAVCRSATFSIADPDHSLGIDADSPWDGAYWIDRMIRVRHEVTVPGVGLVSATPFVGPIVKLTRDGELLNIECQDKACLAVKGTSPVKASKGMNAVDAIRRIMANATGETRFRLPSGLRRNLQKAYTTGWHDEASPWVVCQKIARQLNRQLYYTCDGYLELRPLPRIPTVTATGSVITSPPQVDFDSTAVSNMARVSGTVVPPKRGDNSSTASPDQQQPSTKITAVAVAGPGHPLSPGRLGRNGVPRYLPTIVDDATYKSLADAKDLAKETLDQGLTLTTGAAFDMVPLFHLDVGDLVAAQTDMGRIVVRFNEGSIPLGVSGDMSIGAQRRVSRPAQARVRVTKHRRRRGRG